MNIQGRVIQNGIAVRNAAVQLNTAPPRWATTDWAGYFVFNDVPAGVAYELTCNSFGANRTVPVPSTAGEDPPSQTLDLGLDLKITFFAECDCEVNTNAPPLAAISPGKRTIALVSGTTQLAGSSNKGPLLFKVTNWQLTPAIPFVKSSVPDAIETIAPSDIRTLSAEATIEDAAPGGAVGAVNAPPANPASTNVISTLPVWQMETPQVNVQGGVNIQGQPVGVRLHRTASDPTLDQALWVAIRSRARALSFERYQDFMNRALNFEERRFEVPDVIPEDARGHVLRDLNELGIHMHGVAAYQVLKHLTELFLLLECGVRIQHEGSDRFDPELESRRLGRHYTLHEMEERLRDYLGERAQLPYITRVVRASFPEYLREGVDGRMIGARRINEPCLIELIWSYWMEEGMLVQTINAITRRFQNIRAVGDRDPLTHLEIDPLRPLNNLLWGYIQDELNRLSVRRRAYEYNHHYGLTLYGKATAGMQAADNRSKFLEAFHNLLHQTAIFFKEDFQTTVIADGFPLLNSLREVHLILAQGAHNQFGDLPWTARVEMMLTQYMLARPEIRSFLQGRVMVPYREAWESQVDTMKTMQGWTDVTVSNFRDLAVYGEQLLLSIRYGDWIADNDEYSAINWARFFRPEIQGYLHAYRAATGIDLTADLSSDRVDATIPGILLQKRAAMQRAR